jgi:hypothetical protein
VGHTLQSVVSATSSVGTTSSAAPPSFVVAAAKVLPYGVSSVGPSTTAFGANRKAAIKIGVGSAGRLVRLNVYLQRTATTGSQGLVGALYKDSKGRPGALVATTWHRTFSSSQPAGWYQLGFWSPVPMTPGSYWIGVIAGTSNGVAAFRWTSRTATRVTNYDPYSNGPSNPFGTATTDARLMSVYATWMG